MSDISTSLDRQLCISIVSNASLISLYIINNNAGNNANTNYLYETRCILLKNYEKHYVEQYRNMSFKLITFNFTSISPKYMFNNSYIENFIWSKLNLDY